ncbi:MAG: DUF4230 domain-containing protein [Solobacterium sp.]|nr:DUF4230 domain-containing protein [Solobacterium sp.]
MEKVIIVLLLLIIGVMLGVFIANTLARKKKNESITSSLISEKISDCSDLTTCNLVYVDLVKYEQGSIPLVTKKAFSMIYSANIRAGIDLSEAVVDVKPKTVTITLPETVIQSIEVDTNSLRFYDERFALFNWQNKEDIAAAISAAREDAEKNVNLDKLKQQARLQAEKVVYKLVEPTVGEERKLIVK